MTLKSAMLCAGVLFLGSAVHAGIPIAKAPEAGAPVAVSRTLKPKDPALVALKQKVDNWDHLGDVLGRIGGDLTGQALKCRKFGCEGRTETDIAIALDELPPLFKFKADSPDLAAFFGMGKIEAPNFCVYTGQQCVRGVYQIISANILKITHWTNRAIKFVRKARAEAIRRRFAAQEDYLSALGSKPTAQNCEILRLELAADMDRFKDIQDSLMTAEGEAQYRGYPVSHYMNGEIDFIKAMIPEVGNSLYRLQHIYQRSCRSRSAR